MWLDIVGWMSCEESRAKAVVRVLPAGDASVQSDFQILQTEIITSQHGSFAVNIHKPDLYSFNVSS